MATDKIKDVVGQYGKWIQSYVVYVLTRQWVEIAQRKIAKVTGGCKEVEFFHCVSDHHSFILLQALRIVMEKCTVPLRIRIVLEPARAGLAGYDAPEEIQRQWRRKDAEYLAELYKGVVQFESGKMGIPTDEVMNLGNKLFVHEFDRKFSTPEEIALLDRAIKLNMKILENDLSHLQNEAKSLASIQDDGIKIKLRDNSRYLRDKGHYNSAMIRYGYLWFWGVDRLHYLENILIEEGSMRKDGNGPTVQFDRTCKVKLLEKYANVGEKIDLPKVTVFYSFRSPYSQIVLRPLIDLCKFYGVEIEFKEILPMVMRGLKVPLAKKLYIVSDAAREARRHGWASYGQLNDPVGDPVRKAFHILMEARKINKEQDFLLAWADNVYGKGTDANTISGLTKICKDAGFEFNESWLEINEWQAFAQDNLEEMEKYGFWGVPTLGFDGTWTWGQDRLFVIENAILKASKDKISHIR